MHLLVYTEQITPRLTWILKEILGRRLGLDYLVIDDREAYRHGSVPGVTYARKAVGRRFELVVVPAGLLEEWGVTPAPPPAVHDGEVPLLYPQQKAGALPLDIFSAAFYMLSRYEEYLDFPADAMGRFPAQESLAWRGGWLDVPVVDLWAALLAERLKEQFGMKLPEAVVRVVPTFDVDQAFAYRNKPWWRLVGGGVRAGDLQERWRVWRGRKADPYDTFREIIALHQESGMRPLFFFHTGRWGRYDKSVPLKKKEMQEVVRLCASQAEIGLHPSVRSAHDPVLIAREKERLEEAAGRAVVKSRMHYLMFRFPEIPRALLAAGIQEEYTLGFPEMPGFRAGTAHPFLWYDLEREEETPLLFVPLTVMDGALRTGLKALAGEVPSYLEHYRKRTAEQGGLFVTLWHNHTFAGSDEWQGWGEAYRRWIKNLKE